MKRIIIAAAAVSALATACGRAPLTPPSASLAAPAPVESRAPAAHTRPGFTATVSRIDASTRSRMTSSWRPGCPVGLEDLRLLRLGFWGFDGAPRSGEMVVHRSVASDVVAAFGRLYEARFPIHRMRLIDAYDGDDDRSMAADNTSGFNCRRSVGSPDDWSEHSYGKAIDLNPVENPYVSSSGSVEPPAGRAFLDRSSTAPGVVRSGDAVVRAFRSVGWSWGGDYLRSKDYQHFSTSGR